MKLIFATVCLLVWFNLRFARAQDIDNPETRLNLSKNAFIAYGGNDKTSQRTVRQLSTDPGTKLSPSKLLLLLLLIVSDSQIQFSIITEPNLSLQFLVVGIVDYVVVDSLLVLWSLVKALKVFFE